MPFEKTLALLIPLLAAQPPAVFASSVTITREAPSSIAIVELFTSEGCSSCPPADALLREINLKETPTGQLIVGISEHVTYWNDLGWKDLYSSAVFTDRQNAYAARLSIGGPYTPQMVVNGRAQFVGSNGSALAHALATAQTSPQFLLRILDFKVLGNGIDFTFSFVGHPSKPLDVIAVITDNTDRSNVLMGENSGRTLEHVAVARTLERVAKVSEDMQRTAHLSLPPGMSLSPSKGHHLVLFVQEAGQGAILGAATNEL